MCGEVDETVMKAVDHLHHLPQGTCAVTASCWFACELGMLAPRTAPTHWRTGASPIVARTEGAALSTVDSPNCCDADVDQLEPIGLRPARRHSILDSKIDARRRDTIGPSECVNKAAGCPIKAN